MKTQLFILGIISIVHATYTGDNNPGIILSYPNIVKNIAVALIKREIQLLSPLKILEYVKSACHQSSKLDVQGDITLLTIKQTFTYSMIAKDPLAKALFMYIEQKEREQTDMPIARLETINQQIVIDSTCRSLFHNAEYKRVIVDNEEWLCCTMRITDMSLIHAALKH